MQTIKIFLGSSIDELHDERLLLGDYIMNSVRPIFKIDGVDVEVVKCEDIRSGYTGKPTQEEINEFLKECDLSVFMFKTKAGKQTVAEFEVAQELLKKKSYEIFVYCFVVPEEEKIKSLNSFQSRLKKLGLYWKTCKDITDLESQLIIGLLKFERQLLGKMKPSIVDEESITEKDADARFNEYMLDEKKQAQRRKIIHQDIEDLLQQTKTVMTNEDETIAARIFKVIELYKKADQWAAATDYDKEKYTNLLFDYAKFLDKYGLYHDAEVVYFRQIDLIEELYGNEHEKTATSFNNIGMVYYEQGDYDKALKYCFKALAIREKALGTEHLDTASSYNNIGETYRKLGKYDNALEYYFKALAIYKKGLGEEHSLIATSYNNIGAVYDDQGNNRKALEYYQKALVIREKALGMEHPLTAQSYNNIGFVYDDLGDYAKAMEYYLKALVIDEKVLGHHPRTATDYNNIGCVYYAKCNYGKALEYLLKSLAIREKYLGTEHPDIAQSYNNIGAVYKAQHDYGKALDYHQKALTIWEKSLGTEHPNIAQSYKNIGVVYHELGDFDKAFEYLNKAYQIFKNKFGEEHPDTKDILKNINDIKKVLSSNS